MFSFTLYRVYLLLSCTVHLVDKQKGCGHYPTQVKDHPLIDEMKFDYIYWDSADTPPQTKDP